MKKRICRQVMWLPCVVAGLMVMGPVATQAAEETNVAAAAETDETYQQYLQSLNAVNAAAGYTGNTQMQQPLMQPGMVMMPVIPGMPPVPGQSPEEEQQQVIMRYDKKAVEGDFFGVALPERLFNNVPSDW
ncbi:MAG: hypothetical protein HYS17_06160 [Micavibrio aeruginosavorus]|uniref:Uncharacterized protein n=1 Tax=Micavibrio aeruginosavorus TaxID=349221 RepID=A0A7T5UGC0_9BACT|nr:MAG: hypothetical protein HYS17_06160 [Micavibrio aeruginosavorus]